MAGSDGAHLGATPEDALEVILGGKNADEIELLSVLQLRAQIMGADLDHPMGSYGDYAYCLARVILEAFLDDPTLAQLGENELWDRLRPGNPWFSDATGFQWGWALNAARRCVELGPVPNPALIEVKK